jgi:hypothetical protein
MDQVAAMRYSRLGMTLLITAALWGCGPGDDKGKDKKAEPAPPPKAAPAPPPAPAKKKEEAKPEPKAATEIPGGWKLLGQQQAGPQSERERIEVGRHRGGYNELQVIVQGAPVTFDEVTVTLGNDNQFKPKFQKEQSANSSIVIDLPGKEKKRGVKHVEFVYRTSSGQGTSTVLLYGR